MVNEATKLTATLANLSPEERLTAERRVASLTAIAAALQAGPSQREPGQPNPS